MNRLTTALTLAFGLLAACSSATVDTTEGLQQAGPLPAPMSAEPRFVTVIERAVALNLAGGDSDPPMVSWTSTGSVGLAGIELETGALIDPRTVNGGLEPVIHPIERPAVRVTPEGAAEVAFTAFDHEGISVFWASEDALSRVSGEPHSETALVHMAATPDDGTVMSWLENATLSVALPGPEGPVETDEVDGETCDCCNPVPRFLDSTLVVTYRDRDVVEGQVVRDVVAVRSDDGGTSYLAHVTVADDRWFLDACPFSGPSTVEADGDLVVAWMDARQSVHPDQTSTTIWVDRSADQGATFGVDLPVASGAVHSWPVMAVDADGVIHLVWETQGGDGGLSHASSRDGGRSFDAPRLLVERTESDPGAPGSPSVIVHDENLVVTWADGRQGYVAAWSLSD